MIARAEMSTSAQDTEAQPGALPKTMSVALIGPNDTHRQVVARALASAQGRKIHEFIDYPATLNDLARMMETKFDVVLVDVDTDESYALQIIAKLAELGPAVMAYSARTDDDLLKSCMRAGARDFLPLPSEEPATAAPSSSAPRSFPAPPEATPRQPVAPAQPPARPPVAPTQEESGLAAPAAAPVRSNVTPIVPESRAARTPELNPVSEPSKIDEPSKTAPTETLQPPEDSDFAAWDAANLRRASMPPVPKPDSRPRPNLVTEKPKPKETVSRIVPETEQPREEAAAPLAAPAIERPPVSVDIFRSSQFLAEHSEAAEKQGANWVKWILIGAGPVVLALVLLIVFTRSSSSNSGAAHAKEAQPAPSEPVKETPVATDRLIVNATGKTPSTQPAISKPSPAAPQPGSQPTATSPAEQAPVSPDAMAEQLVAPTRIAGQIKKTASPADEPPPTAPTSIALGENSTVPGSVFGSGSNPKVTPHAVPISAGLAQGMLIHKTQPVYPKFAQEAHVTGTVLMKATITKQGSIEGIQVLSGPKLLAPAAVDAVKTWRYRPYMLDGQPVAVETNITIVFGSK